jgi:hypothetical protein
MSAASQQAAESGSSSSGRQQVGTVSIGGMVGWTLVAAGLVVGGALVV